MKKFLLVFLTAILISSSWGCSIEDKEQKPIFGEITINDGIIVSLGQDISGLKEVCIKNVEGYHLVSNTFSAEFVDSFSIYVTGSNRIHAIHTYYDEGVPLEERAKVYSNHFNKDYTTVELEGDSKNLKILFWQDNETLFGLVERTTASKLVTYSIHYDRKQGEEYLSQISDSTFQKASVDLRTTISTMKALWQN